MDLRSVADELYGLRPGVFVARRTALEGEARTAGDRGLAARVRRLPKPTVAAWAVNLLVRREAEQVEQVLALGAALREAQAAMAGDDLRELGRERRRLTAAVARRAQELAGDLGVRVGDRAAGQVEETLHAAMVDERAAAAVRTGLLARPLSATGLEAPAGAPALAVPAGAPEGTPARAERPTSRPDLTVVPDRSRVVEDAVAELGAAESALADADRRLDKARRKVARREAKGLQLRAELEELRRRVTEVEQRIETNEEALADAEDSRDERAAVVAEARTAVDAARGALADLR